MPFKLIILSVQTSFFKERNALSNSIDNNFFLWINNAYMYVWPCH